MKFGIDSIIVWSNSGEQRLLRFERNKVNVLTGESNTGKSTLLDILDYCFLASSHEIAQSVINENVSWYGVSFYINEKSYTIARQRPRSSKVSDQYYFSSTGSIPAEPKANMAESTLKQILEAEFSIDESVTVAYGGQALKAGSKISFRYFLLFCTISEDIITSKNVFFDKQQEERYKEALPRIFDIALGIDTLENISARERKENLRKQISRLERKRSAISDGRGVFEQELENLAARASSYGLAIANDKALTVANLTAALRQAASPSVDDVLEEKSKLSEELFDVEQRLRRLRHFAKESTSYKTTLKTTRDSLLPLEEILKQAPEIVKSEVFDELISNIKSDLADIKQAVSGKFPIEAKVSGVIKKLETQRDEIQARLRSLPSAPASFDNEREKWIFVGETLGRLDVYYAPETLNSEDASDIKSLERKMEEITVADVAEKKEAVLSVINEVALEHLRSTGDVLANYATYIPEFVYKEKRLRLRKPRSSDVENIGSSSNHMFLHLLHFLSLQEVALGQGSPFVPNFLIIDQPSRPYYPDDKPKDSVVLTNSDTAKVTTAFQLLNDFVMAINKRYNQGFQMIVLEHVPASTFTGMKHVHVLPEFRDGEALIPTAWT